MSHKWTEESARSYIAKVQAGKNQIGLKYCSAIDFISNHVTPKVEKHPLAAKEDRNDNHKSRR